MSRYLPDGQILQTACPVCASPASEYLPTPHDLQVSVNCNSVASEYFPGGHAVHVADLLERSIVPFLANHPSGQRSGQEVGPDDVL